MAMSNGFFTFCVNNHNCSSLANIIINLQFKCIALECKALMIHHYGDV